VANTYLKAEKIAATGLGLLQREIVLPALVWANAGGSFVGAAGDTITMRVPARTQSRSRTLRGARGLASEGQGIIQMDELTEHSVDVTLDEAIYSAVPTTDEELTLDITSYGAQILAPMVRAVAEGLENKLADEMVNATYAHTATIADLDPANPLNPTKGVYAAMVKARRYLNEANVPINDRIVVMGPGMEEQFLLDPHLHEFDRSGSESALRDATIGRIAGFGQVVVSNALPADFGVAFHRTAFVLNTQAPAVPSGVPFGSSASAPGLPIALRFLRDYDFRNVQDRALVDLYAGTNIVADGVVSEVQTLTPSGTISGGTFTLTARGWTTGPLQYNATAADIAAALNKLPGVFCSASGGPIHTTPVVVTFKDSGDVAQMTLASSLTGSGAAVAVSTTTPGTPTFVRAVKLELA
jgi:P22 coat protein - gene protein 5